LPDYIPVDALAKAFKVDLGALKVLNPALRPPIWNGARFVPRGYGLRIPGVLPASDVTDAWARVVPAQRYVAQRNDGNHKMRRSETLAGVAAASGVTLSHLLAANGWNANHEVARGDTVRIPLPASRGAPSVAASLPPEAPSAPAPAPVVAAAAIAPPAAELAVSALPPPREPVSERQAETAALLPAAAPTGNGDPTDYDVGAGDTVFVQAGETLGHFADWSKTSSATLRTLNKLHKNAMVTLGHKLKLDLSRVSAADFTAARRGYHKDQQDAFFATHRIAGTDTYAVKRGESLWMIAQHNGDLPLWLISEYNPDVDFGDVRPGTTITLPKIAPINRQ
jgi:membrane-bound lytic murein transglycosylase D